MSAMDDKHLAWLKGDRAAFALITELFEVLHFWDDLIDGDREVAAQEVNSRMWSALVGVQENPFWQRNFHALMPVLKVAIANWHAANEMERTADEQDKRIAFILRSTYVDLVTAAAYIVGGKEWAGQVALDARRDTSAEGWEAYLAALQNEKRKD